MRQLFSAFFIFVGLAAGDTLTFNISGTGTGHWGAQTFTNAAFTFTFLLQDADTLRQPPCCAVVRSTPAGTSGTVSVAGFGASGFGAGGNQAVFVNPAASSVGIWHYNLSDFLTVANPAFSTWDLSTTIGPFTGTAFVYPLGLDLGAGVSLAFTSVSNVTFSARRGASGGIPAVVSMSPGFGNSSSGVANAFQFVVSDAAGATDLQGMNILFSDARLNRTGDPYACWLWFQTSDKTLSAYNKGVWRGAPIGPGGSILNGDLCSVDTAAAVSATDGNNLTLSVPVTFQNQPVEPDTMLVYVRAANNENVDSGYQQTGMFTVYAGASPNFTMNVTPTLRDVAIGSDTTYTVTVVPKPGFNDTVTFSADAGVFGATTTFQPPTVTGAGSSILTVTTPEIPDNISPPYLGGGYAVNVSGQSSSGEVRQAADLLVEVGPPTIQVIDAPTSALSHVYAVSIHDVLAYSNWATGITGFNLLFAPSLDGRGACWVFYDGTTLWLASDDASTWTSAGTLGSITTAQNSQCTVGGPAGSPGPRLFPHVGWYANVPITFNSGFAAGANLLWVRAGNLAGFGSDYFWNGQ